MSVAACFRKRQVCSLFEASPNGFPFREVPVCLRLQKYESIHLDLNTTLFLSASLLRLPSPEFSEHLLSIFFPFSTLLSPSTPMSESGYETAMSSQEVKTQTNDQDYEPFLLEEYTEGDLRCNSPRAQARRSDNIPCQVLRSIAFVICRRVISPDQTNTVVEFSKPLEAVEISCHLY